MLREKNKAFSILYLLTFTLVSLPFLSSAAYAQCTGPSAPEGRIEYFSAGEHVFKYCDGTDWVSWGGGSGNIWQDSGSGYIEYTSTLGGILVAPISSLPPATGAIGSSSTTLDGLTDVDAASPSDNDCLVYNNGSGNWETSASCGSGGGGGATPAGADGQVQFNSGGSALGASSDLFWDDANSRLGIADATPDVELDVVGDINYTGIIVDVSDVRMKYDIKPLENPLNKLTSLNGFSFKMKDDEDKQTEYGVSAQDVKHVFPELVHEVDSDGTLGVSYDGLIAPMIEAIKELKAENDALRARVEALESEHENNVMEP